MWLAYRAYHAKWSWELMIPCRSGVICIDQTIFDNGPVLISNIGTNAIDLVTYAFNLVWILIVYNITVCTCITGTAPQSLQQTESKTGIRIGNNLTIKTEGTRTTKTSKTSTRYHKISSSSCFSSLLFHYHSRSWSRIFSL